MNNLNDSYAILETLASKVELEMLYENNIAIEKVKDIETAHKLGKGYTLTNHSDYYK